MSKTHPGQKPFKLFHPLAQLGWFSLTEFFKTICPSKRLLTPYASGGGFILFHAYIAG
jgi:hypothetical protein